jgi:hypothetical protein
MGLEQIRIMANARPDIDLDLGYTFSPPCNPDQLCHRKLDGILQGTPTLLHYDPETVIFRVAPNKLGNSAIKDHYPWIGKEKCCIFVSTVIMKGRVEKVVEVFTFGGELLIVSNDEHTHCSLKSPVAVLWLDPVDSFLQMENFLADEVNILLAKRRESWDEEHPKDDFDKRIANTDPFMLYMTSISVLQEKFNHFLDPLPENLL